MRGYSARCYGGLSFPRPVLTGSALLDHIMLGAVQDGMTEVSMWWFVVLIRPSFSWTILRNDASPICGIEEALMTG